MAKTNVNKATSRSFKSIGRSLEASRGALEERTRRNIDQLKLSALQQSKASETYIGGLADAGRFEQRVLNEKHKLEDKARTTQYAALSIKADRDVNRLEGEAKELKKWSDHLNKIMPKRAKMFGQMALGTLKLVDQVKGMAEWEEFHQNGGMDKFVDGVVNTNYNIAKHGENDEYKYKLDPAEANAVNDRTVRFSSRFAQKKFVKFVEQNKAALQADLEKNWNKARGVDGANTFDYNEHNVLAAHDLSARALLREYGIKEGSPAGKEIIEKFRSWGAIKQGVMIKSRLVTETTTRIEDIGDDYDAMDVPKEKELLFNSLVRAFKNGHHKIEGKIIEPGQISDADAGIMAMRHIIKSNKDITRTNVREEFGSFAIPGSEREWDADLGVKDLGKLVKGEYWTKKHANRFEEEVVEWADEIWKARGQKIKDELEADGVYFNREDGEFDQKVTEAVKDKKITIQEGWELLNMVDSAKISDAQKKVAFKKINYEPSSYSPNGNLINFMRHMNDGNIEEALKIARMTKGGLTTKDELFLNNKIEFTKEIHSVQEKGLKGLLTELLNEWKLEEKEKSHDGKGVLSNSGEASVRLAQEMVVKKFQSTRFTINASGEKVPSAVPLEQRWNDAKDTVLNEKKKGQEVMYKNGKLVKADGNELSAEEAANPFNYIRNFGPGKGNKSLFYPKTATQNQVKAESARALIKEKAMTGLENKPDIRNDLFKQVGEYTVFKPESIDYALTSGLITEKEMLGNENFVNTLDRALIYDVAKAWRDGDKTNPHYAVSLDFLLNREGIRTMMNHDKGKKWTNTTFANALIVASHPNIPLKDLPQFPADYSDAIAIQNERKPVRFENRHANIMFQGGLTQGVAAHSNHVEYMLGGSDKNSAYFSENGIEFNFDGTFFDPQKGINSKLFNANVYDWDHLQILNITPLWMQHGFKSEREFQRVNHYEGFR